MKQVHTFVPVYDINSRILILGSFPSVRSREEGFYYGHPSNRFWTVLSNILNCRKPETLEEKKNMLLDNKIALWDVVCSCKITGSSDSSIKNVTPNDISVILEVANISSIFANGKMAYRLYKKYIMPVAGHDILDLPSTSSANAGYSLDSLVEAWNIIKMGIEDA